MDVGALRLNVSVLEALIAALTPDLLSKPSGVGEFGGTENRTKRGSVSQGRRAVKWSAGVFGKLISARQE